MMGSKTQLNAAPVQNQNQPVNIQHHSKIIDVFEKQDHQKMDAAYNINASPGQFHSKLASTMARNQPMAPQAEYAMLSQTMPRAPMQSRPGSSTRPGSR
jgi:hypothetical protein